jgi:hypothetical protein
LKNGFFRHVFTVNFPEERSGGGGPHRYKWLTNGGETWREICGELKIIYSDH